MAIVTGSEEVVFVMGSSRDGRGERGPRRERRGRRYDASACGAQRHANDGGTGKRAHRCVFTGSHGHPSVALASNSIG